MYKKRFSEHTFPKDKHEIFLSDLYESRLSEFLAFYQTSTLRESFLQIHTRITIHRIIFSAHCFDVLSK